MKSLLAIVVLLFSLNSFAKSSADIFTGGTSSSLLFSKDVNNSYEASFNLALGYDHAFESGLQLGTTLSTTIFSSMTSVTVLVGPGYNFSPTDLENSFYVDLKAGANGYDWYGTTSYDAMAAVLFGKRFKLAENISYSPSISVTHVFQEENDPTFSVNIARFSLLF